MSTTWTEQRRISGQGVQRSQNDNDAKMRRRRRRQCGQLAVTMVSPLLLCPPTTSCLLLFPPVPICSCLLLPALVPPPASSRFLSLSPVMSCLADLLMPHPTSSERCQRPCGASWGHFRKLFGGLSGASGGLFGGFVNPSGSLLGPLGNSRAPLGGLLGFLGALGGFWGTSWGPLGGLLETSSGSLGGVFVVLGTSWDLCGGVCEPPGAHRRRESENGKSLISIRFYKFLPRRKRSVLQGLLGTSGALGLSGASLEASGTSLGPSETRRCRLGGGSGPPWAAWTAV